MGQQSAYDVDLSFSATTFDEGHEACDDFSDHDAETPRPRSSSLAESKLLDYRGSPASSLPRSVCAYVCTHVTRRNTHWQAASQQLIPLPTPSINCPACVAASPLCLWSPACFPPRALSLTCSISGVAFVSHACWG